MILKILFCNLKGYSQNIINWGRWKSIQSLHGSRLFSDRHLHCLCNSRSLGLFPILLESYRARKLEGIQLHSSILKI
jgi:hypothetical protein